MRDAEHHYFIISKRNAKCMLRLHCACCSYIFDT